MAVRVSELRGRERCPVIGQIEVASARWDKITSPENRSHKTRQRLARHGLPLSHGPFRVLSAPSPLPCNNTLGNPLSLTLGTQAGMKSISCTVWVLGALMVLASLDTVPDPPAVNPQAVNVISHLRTCPNRFCERLTCDSSCTSSHLQLRWIAFTSAYEPNRPSDRIALTGHAADPSPPALEARRKLYFQS
jgi:hypothetical protein